MKKWNLIIDVANCEDCNNCFLSCKDEFGDNDFPAYSAAQPKHGHRWMNIMRKERGMCPAIDVAYLPTPCMHCDNAPCENVCPVSATNHSNEGINQMSYNRCIGTKYCINNCPYRVRRFNWYAYVNNQEFEFNQNSDLGKMVLNPDVTVRERGVVEKCSFCVQRIQEKKMQAKLEERSLKDGEIKTACAQACPADALVFGDLNDPESKVSKMFKDERNYHLLEELHTLPSVGYLTKVRNTKV